LNTYAYVEGAPLTLVDKDGLIGIGRRIGGGLSINLPIVGGFSISGGFGIEFRQCCAIDGNILNELIRIERAGVGFGTPSATLAPTGRGNMELLRFGELPACIVGNEEIKRPFSTVDVSVGVWGGRVDFASGRGGVGLQFPAGSGASVAINVFERRTVLHTTPTGLSCKDC
jgi:hypothetical protein